MEAVTIKTSKGPMQVDTEPGNKAAPIRVKLGEGFMSMTVFLTRQQAEDIMGALAVAVVECPKRGAA